MKGLSMKSSVDSRILNTSLTEYSLFNLTLVIRDGSFSIFTLNVESFLDYGHNKREPLKSC